MNTTKYAEAEFEVQNVGNFRWIKEVNYFGRERECSNSIKDQVQVWGK